VDVLSLLKTRFLPHLTLKWIEEELPYVRADEGRDTFRGSVGGARIAQRADAPSGLRLGCS